MTWKRTFAAIVVLASFAPVAGAEEEIRYFAILIQGKKSGHAKHTRTVAGEKVTTVQEMHLVIKRAGTPLTIRQSSTHVETRDGKPLSFTSSQNLGPMVMRMEGTMQAGGKLLIKTTVAGQIRTSAIDWPKGALMSEGLRLQQLGQSLKEGTTFQQKTFLPEFQMAVTATVRVGAKRKTDLLGRVVELIEVKTTMTMPLAGKITSTTYLNDDHEDLKSIVPIMNMHLELIACSRQYALSKNEPTDFMTKVLLTSPQPLGDLRKAKSITYHLKPTGSAEIRFAGSGAQTAEKAADGSWTVKVTPHKPPAGGAMPYKGTDKAAVEALKPTKFLQSDRKEIVTLARKAAGGAKDPATAAKRIRDFVHKYIRKKNLTVGYASALEVAASREGDCSEHAVLAAALCRAVGIPAEVVAGVTYVSDFAGKKDVFGPHAWFRVWIAGKWYPMDAAMPDGFEAGHIAIGSGNGDVEGFFHIVTTLGNFEIGKAVVEK